MVTPYTVPQQRHFDGFKPEVIFQLIFEADKYDACYKQNLDGEVVQAKHDLPNVKNDVKWFLDATGPYTIVKHIPNGMFHYKNPKEKAVKGILSELIDYLKQHRE